MHILVSLLFVYIGYTVYVRIYYWIYTGYITIKITVFGNLLLEQMIAILTFSH